MSARESTFGIAHELLGRHVARCAHRQSDLRDRACGVTTSRLLDHARDAEVRQDRVAVLQEDVLGLEVSMHDAEGVRERERVDDFTQDANHFVDGQCAVQHESLAQRFARDERCDVEQQPVARACGEHGKDVRVLELGSDKHLALEALRACFARQFRQHLHDHPTIQRTLGRQEEPAHPSRSELALDLERIAEGMLDSILEFSGHSAPSPRKILRRRCDRHQIRGRMRRRTSECDCAKLAAVSNSLFRCSARLAYS